MTALAEALLAAQRQAIGALAKPYLAGNLAVDEVTARLIGMGCNDVIDQTQLLAAWDVLGEWGVAAPKATQAEPQRDPATEPASEAQLKYLRDLADKKGTTAPDGQLTKARASEAIEQLKAGTYNPDEWTAPF
jgi:hypothetical protein